MKKVCSDGMSDGNALTSVNSSGEGKDLGAGNEPASGGDSASSPGKAASTKQADADNSNSSDWRRELIRSNPRQSLAVGLVLALESLFLFLIPKVSGTNLTLLIGIIGLLAVVLVILLGVVVTGQSENKGRAQLKLHFIIALMVFGLVGLGGYVARLHTHVAVLNGSISHLNEQNGGLKQDLTNSQTLAQSLDTKNAEIERVRLQHWTAWLESSNRASRAESEITRVQKQNESLEKQLAQSRSALGSKENEMRSVTEALQRLQFQYSQLDTNKSEVESAYKQLQELLSKRLGEEDRKAVRDLVARLEQMNSQIESLRNTNHELELWAAPLKRAGLRKFYGQSREFLGDFPTLSEQAKSTIDFFGVNFFITAQSGRAHLLTLLEQGKTLRFLILDPESPELPKFAAEFDQTPDMLKKECELGYTALVSIEQEWKQRSSQSRNPGQIEIRFSSWMPRLRMYAFDKFEGGKVFFTPYLNGIDSPNVPGYLVEVVKDGLAPMLLRSFHLAWTAGRSTPRVAEAVVAVAPSTQKVAPESQPTAPAQPPVAAPKPAIKDHPTSNP